MQTAADDINDWSIKNQLGLNTTKTKEMRIAFGNSPHIEPLEINSCTIERVNHSKLLGVIIQDDLKWDLHVSYMYKKASKRLHYLRCLKRSGLSTSELRMIYLSIIRSVCEYACPVWSTSITKEQSHDLESIQRRALRIILPKLDYPEACEKLNIPSLASRRNEICRAFFNSMKNENHKLHDMLPQPRSSQYILRRSLTYPLPKCNTKRYKDSFIPYCLFHYQ